MYEFTFKSKPDNVNEYLPKIKKQAEFLDSEYKIKEKLSNSINSYTIIFKTENIKQTFSKWFAENIPFLLG